MSPTIAADTNNAACCQADMFLADMLFLPYCAGILGDDPGPLTFDLSRAFSERRIPQ
jgi:hypothetical protein